MQAISNEKEKMKKKNKYEENFEPKREHGKINMTKIFNQEKNIE